jgi:beta-phosphoglucomutase
MNTALIFDLDGTLVLTEPYHCQAFTQVLKPFGIDYNYALHTGSYTGNGDTEILTTELKKANMSLRNLDELRSQKQAIYQKLVERNGVPIVTGATEFLEKAKNARISLAIASSTVKHNAQLILEKTQLLPYFDLVITRESVIRTKPYPDIFLATAEALEVSPSRAVVFEDAPRGIEAAQRGDFATVALLTTSTKEALNKKGADLLIENYHDLNLPTVLSLKNTK